MKKFKINEKYNKYKIHNGDIIKIGRIIARIKDIKFSNKKGKNDSKSINTDKSETNSINESKISNKLILKDIGDFTNEKEVNNNKGQKILSLANQRNATDPNLGDIIQVLALNKGNKENIMANSNEMINNVEKIEINHNKIKKQNSVCRICYGEEEDEKENPMVQPCQCSGSLKYIHLQCLKHWIMTRSCTKVDDNDCCKVFLFKEIECEICKSKFILLSDVSVSRVHCLFYIEGKNIYLKDNNSKFGTLVLVQTPTIRIAENLPLYLQVGRTFFNFNVKTNSNIFSCCGVEENPNIFYYYNQNEKQVKLNRIITVKTENNDSEEEKDNKEEKEILKYNNDKYNEIKSKESNEDNSIKIVIDDE